MTAARPGRPLVIAAVLSAALVGAAGASVIVAPEDGSRAPSEEEYIRLMNGALDELIQRLERHRHSRLSFGANLFFAHEVAVRRMPLDVLLSMVDAFADAGLDRVDVNMGLFPWRDGHQPTIEKYDRLLEHVRKRGLRLAINPQYSRVHEVEGFEGWRTAALEIYPVIARRYQPDTFIVVHEPTTQASRLGAEVSPGEWERFASDAARAIRAVAPRARLGAGGRFVPTPGQSATLDERVSATIGNQAYRETDAKWLRAMTLYASSLGLEAVTPFWTQTFFAYVPEDWSGLDPRYNRRVIQAVRRGERTETYRTLEALVREFGAPGRED